MEARPCVTWHRDLPAYMEREVMGHLIQTDLPASQRSMFSRVTKDTRYRQSTGHPPSIYYFQTVSPGMCDLKYNWYYSSYYFIFQVKKENDNWYEWSVWTFCIHAYRLSLSPKRKYHQMYVSIVFQMWENDCGLFIVFELQKWFVYKRPGKGFLYFITKDAHSMTT